MLAGKFSAVKLDAKLDIHRSWRFYQRLLTGYYVQVSGAKLKPHDAGELHQMRALVTGYSGYCGCCGYRACRRRGEAGPVEQRERWTWWDSGVDGVERWKAQ